MEGIFIQGVRTVTLVLGVATSFVNYRDISGFPVAIVTTRENAAAAKSYEDLRARRVANFTEMMMRMTLELVSYLSSFQPFVNVRAPVSRAGLTNRLRRG